MKVIPEPTAAAIAFGVDKMNTYKNGRIMVFDLGGGTFDISVMEINGQEFTVKGVSGDGHLRGEDFDEHLLEHLVKEFENEKGISIKKNHKALRRVKTYVEKAKIELSAAPSTNVNIDSLAEDEDLDIEVTRAQLEQMCKKDFDRMMKCVEDLLSQLKLSKNDIDEVVLVGGSTRIPKVKEILKDFFGKAPNQ